MHVQGKTKYHYSSARARKFACTARARPAGANTSSDCCASLKAAMGTFINPFCARIECGSWKVSVNVFCLQLDMAEKLNLKSCYVGI